MLNRLRSRSTRQHRTRKSSAAGAYIHHSPTDAADIAAGVVCSATAVVPEARGLRGYSCVPKVWGAVARRAAHGMRETSGMPSRCPAHSES
ncbi:hypothetical protein GCM10018785_71890 [Streptomyces longispororuber]|uniref:Uncharacterized protein n=1 Tax=Streptomyces longispororuber TaxID=68230 RepID=A0A919ACC6_9ACTN|nr:hypothetical protein GCM10018785_71890 [Streptomyces longispororuber]